MRGKQITQNHLQAEHNDNENRAVVERRLAILELARKLGNVSEACRRTGIDRTTFYSWKKRYESLGLDGLTDRPISPTAHPMRTPAHVEDRICALALKYPLRGCNWLERQMIGNGTRISATTIQKLLNKRSLGTRRERWLALEAAYGSGRIEFTAEQITFMERFNPCLRDRKRCGQRPGEFLWVETANIGFRLEDKRINLHMVVDDFGCYAFATIREALSKSLLNTAVGHLLADDVLPFYEARGINIGSLEFGTEIRKIEWGDTVDLENLTSRGISLRERAWWADGRNGCLERFHRTAVVEFFEPALSERRCRTLVALRSDFQHWLRYYNFDRPHPGFRNYGKPPAQFLGIDFSCSDSGTHTARRDHVGEGSSTPVQLDS